jgi:hypothetical protein
MAMPEPAKQAYIDERNQLINEAIRKAKAKTERLRLLKARHEQFLADRREEPESDEEQTAEL